MGEGRRNNQREMEGEKKTVHFVLFFPAEPGPWNKTVFTDCRAEGRAWSWLSQLYSAKEKENYKNNNIITRITKNKIKVVDIYRLAIVREGVGGEETGEGVVGEQRRGREGSKIVWGYSACWCVCEWEESQGIVVASSEPENL